MTLIFATGNDKDNRYVMIACDAWALEGSSRALAGAHRRHSAALAAQTLHFDVLETMNGKPQNENSLNRMHTLRIRFREHFQFSQ